MLDVLDDFEEGDDVVGWFWGLEVFDGDVAVSQSAGFEKQGVVALMSCRYCDYFGRRIDGCDGFCGREACCGFGEDAAAAADIEDVETTELVWCRARSALSNEAVS